MTRIEGESNRATAELRAPSGERVHCFCRLSQKQRSRLEPARQSRYATRLDSLQIRVIPVPKCWTLQAGTNDSCPIELDDSRNFLKNPNLGWCHLCNPHSPAPRARNTAAGPPQMSGILAEMR